MFSFLHRMCSFSKHFIFYFLRLTTPHQNHGCDCCEEEVFHFPSAFNSAPVLPPCLRRRSAVSLSFPNMATSSGVSPPSSFAFTSAPLSISSSEISLKSYLAAKCKRSQVFSCTEHLFGICSAQEKNPKIKEKWWAKRDSNPLGDFALLALWCATLCNMTS